MTTQVQLDSLVQTDLRNYAVATSTGSASILLNFYDPNGYFISNQAVVANTTLTGIVSLYKTATGNILPNGAKTMYLTTSASLLLTASSANDGRVDSTAVTHPITMLPGWYRLGVPNIKDHNGNSMPLWAYCFAGVGGSTNMAGLFTDKNGFTVGESSFTVGTSGAALGSLTTIPESATGFMVTSISGSVFWNTGGSPGNIMFVVPSHALFQSGSALVGLGDLA